MKTQEGNKLSPAAILLIMFISIVYFGWVRPYQSANVQTAINKKDITKESTIEFPKVGTWVKLKSGYPISFYPWEISRYVKLLLSDDKEAMTKFYASGNVSSSREGMEVYIERMSAPLVEIRKRGETDTLWTVLGAIDY